ncbi:MAG: IS630 family transposase [Deltaproteobacteria bacterium]|jgi:transposase|nr:IS630 family transposase [Deltaproteobacteria bacterium]
MDKAFVKNTSNLPVRLLFQDEAHFGTMSDPGRCWVPAPFRTKVNSAACVREYNYVFGAVCPANGVFHHMRALDMKTHNMSLFLKQISKAHRMHFVLMVVDGATSHMSKDLIIPSNVALIFLPPYSPELNPIERIWNKLRRDDIANRYFNNLDEAMEAVDHGLSELKRKRSTMKSLTFWLGIKEISNANYN